MLAIVIPIAFTLMCLAGLLNLWRVVHGPDLPDRILALDTLYINSIALLVLFGVHRDTTIYFEVALLIAMMGFVGTVAIAKYLTRGSIIE
jgi:multicomponent K+:H+ antiporter subunit F